MKKICLALLMSVALLPSAPVFAQESADEIKSQIESSGTKLQDSHRGPRCGSFRYSDG